MTLAGTSATAAVLFLGDKMGYSLKGDFITAAGLIFVSYSAGISAFVGSLAAFNRISHPRVPEILPLS